MKKSLATPLFYVLAAFTMVFTSCTEKDCGCAPPTKAGKYYGKQVKLGDGTAKAWVELNHQGETVSVGISLSEKALTKLPGLDDSHPHESFYSQTLSLPKEKGNTPFDHITLDWNPHGHDPKPIYTKPHFDFHFYMMPEAERLAITPNDPKIEDVPEAKFMPTGYVAIPGGVPQMGKHWMDPTSAEFQPGGVFSKTFLHGSYDKRFTFYEPMITLEYLLSKPNITEDLKLPQAYQKTGLAYPTKYSIKYDTKQKEYIVSLDGFLTR